MHIELSDNKKILIVSEATEAELDQLQLSLTKRIDTWRFNPLVKKGIWDGYVSYFKDDQYIPSGLWREVIDIGKKYGLNVEYGESISGLFDNNINADEFEKWAIDLFEDSDLTPRDYQIEAAYNILKYRV